MRLLTRLNQAKRTWLRITQFTFLLGLPWLTGTRVDAFDPAIQRTIQDTLRDCPPGDYDTYRNLPSHGSDYVVDDKVFESPDGAYIARTVRPRQADEIDNSAIIEIVRRSDDRIVLSVHEDAVRAFQALWGPDSHLMAVSFKTETNGRKMRVFALSPDRISEAELPADLNLRQLLPANDPGRNFRFYQIQMSPIQWQSSTDLNCEIIGVGRRVDPLPEQTEAMPGTAFVTVGYRLTIRIAEHASMVLAAEQTQYELNE